MRILNNFEYYKKIILENLIILLYNSPSFLLYINNTLYYHILFNFFIHLNIFKGKLL